MSLFQKNILAQNVKTLQEALITEKWNLFQSHFLDPSVQKNIENSKEEQYQAGFLRDLFVSILGYTLNPDANFNLTTEYKNARGNKKADGAIVIGTKVKAVIELKGTNTIDLNKIEEQAFSYKNNQPDCTYIITSNFKKLRFYIDNAVEYQDFDLFRLTKPEFKEMYLCLSFSSINQDLPKKLKEESLTKEKNITNDLYKDYSLFKRELFQNLIELNPEYEPLELFKKSQKLLDRFLFLFFAEDRNLLQPNSVRTIINHWQTLKDLDAHTPLIDRFRLYFGYLNTGHSGKDLTVYAYNGGLFLHDEVLDVVKIDDDLLHRHTLKLSEYDFDSEVDVNILGHIFENSLNELDEVKARLEGKFIDKAQTKRKKDGVFYTPEYITRYIVENTVGKLCKEKKTELIIEEDSFADEKNRTKDKKNPLTVAGKKLYSKLTQYRNWLLQLTICDPACGSGAFLNEALDFLIKEHQYIDELQAQLFADSLVLSDVEGSILENNLYGVDLNEESIEIAKLSLWLRTAKPHRKLNNLSNNLKQGNSLIDDPEVAGENAFNWQKEFPDVFAKGGFDVVIGNPPYVQLQKMKKLSAQMEKLNYQVFEKTGDLYCLFYEKGNQILRTDGLLGFITSNKWMRANYGKSLRKYLLEYTQPYLLVDLGSGIFDSATVDSNILVFKKEALVKQESFIALDLSKEQKFTDFTVYEKLKTRILPTDNEMWVITNEIARKLKQKIEQAGVALKDWDISIYRGVLTGLNEAFIIDEEKKNELLAQDPKSAEIIEPILRGRDINRYYVEYQNLWLINSHNGVKEKRIPRINVEEYPAIKKYLDTYFPQLEKRADKGDTPYNLRNCAYLEEFEKSNIFYPDISQRLSFMLIHGFYSNNTGYFINKGNRYLLTVLNSTLINYFYKNISAQLGKEGLRSFSIYIENIPIPKISKVNQQPFIEKADQMLGLNKELQEVSKKFLRSIEREFNLTEFSKKLGDWHNLPYNDFLQELKKKKIDLSLSQKSEWEDYFETEKRKALQIQETIQQTDTEIDQMVYGLYQLSPEEIKLIESETKI